MHFQHSNSCPLQHLDLDLDKAGSCVANGAEGRPGEIDDPPAFKSTAVIDLDHDALAVGEVGDPDQGAKG